MHDFLWAVSVFSVLFLLMLASLVIGRLPGRWRLAHDPHHKLGVRCALLFAYLAKHHWQSQLSPEFLLQSALTMG